MLSFTEQTVENLIVVRRLFLDVLKQQNDEMANSAKAQGEQVTRATHEAAHEMTEAATQRERKAA